MIKWVLMAGLIIGSGLYPAQPQVVRPAPQSPEVRQREERIHQGMLKLRQADRMGQRMEAIRIGEELLQEFPGTKRVEDVMIHLYRLVRRDVDLINLLKGRINRNPDDLAAVREVCSHLLARRKQGEALELLQTVIEANPLDENRYRMGAVLFRSHRLVELAIDIYRQGRKAIGRETVFAAELAQLEEARGDYGASIGEYLLLVMDPDRRSRARRKVIKLLERAPDDAIILQKIRNLKKKHPKSSPVQDIAAVAFLHTTRYDEAFRAIGAADRYADDQGEHLLEFARVSLIHEEGTQVDLARARTGVKALKLLSKRHPKSNLLPESARLMGEGLVSLARQTDRPEERRQLLDEAVESLELTAKQASFPKLQRDALALKGIILFEDLGKNEEALATFNDLARDLHEAGESDHLIRVQKGLVLVAMDQFEEARKVLQEVAQLPEVESAENLPRPKRRRIPTATDVGRARAAFYLAELELIEGNYETAEKGFAALAADAPEDRLANDCLDLALVILESEFDNPQVRALYGDYRKAKLRKRSTDARAALEAIVEGYEETSLHPLALFDLAKGIEADGKFEVALQFYQQLLKKHQDHRLAPRALESIGDVHLEKLGSPMKAVQSYERIMIDYPDDLFLDAVRKKLILARRMNQGGSDETP